MHSIDLLFPTYLKLVYHQFRNSQEIYLLAQICLEFRLIISIFRNVDIFLEFYYKFSDLFLGFENFESCGV